MKKKSVLYVHPQTGEKKLAEIPEHCRLAEGVEILWDTSEQGEMPDSLTADLKSEEAKKKKERKTAAEEEEKAFESLAKLDTKAEWSAAETQKAVKALVVLAQRRA